MLIFSGSSAVRVAEIVVLQMRSSADNSPRKLWLVSLGPTHSPGKSTGFQRYSDIARGSAQLLVPLYGQFPPALLAIVFRISGVAGTSA